MDSAEDPSYNAQQSETTNFLPARIRLENR